MGHDLVLITDYLIKEHVKTDGKTSNLNWQHLLSCIVDGDGKRYSIATYNSPFKMDRGKAIEVLSFWDNFEFDSDGNKLDYLVVLPKGSIKKLIGRDLTWEDEPVELK